MRALLAVLSLIFATGAHAEAAGSDAPANPNAEQVEQAEQELALDVYAAPKVIDLGRPYFPESARKTGGDGWVNTQFMVDAEGKPYEIVVTDAIGHSSLRKAAVRAVERSTFEPANLNGVPLDAGLRRKIFFMLEGKGPVGRAGRTAYRNLTRAARQGDKAKADEAMARIAERAAKLNLREDAWLHLAKYAYYEKWGTRAEQLQALNRAVAHERSDTYLSDEMYRHAQLARFRLLVQLNHFAAALEAFETLKELDPNERRLDALAPMVDEIRKVEQDDRAFVVDGRLDDHGYWSHRLLKDHFSLRKVEGKVAELKLYCDTAFVFFPFDPQLDYRVAEGQGDCTLTVVGNAGTTFALAQG